MEHAITYSIPAGGPPTPHFRDCYPLSTRMDSIRPKVQTKHDKMSSQ